MRAVISSMIHVLACAAPPLTACGEQPRLSHRQHLLAMPVMAGYSVRSVPMSGGESTVGSFICAPDAASSRKHRLSLVKGSALAGEAIDAPPRTALAKPSRSQLNQTHQKDASRHAKLPSTLWQPNDLKQKPSASAG